MLPRSPAPSEWDERPTHVSRVGHLGSARSAAQFCRAAVLGWFQYCSARPQTVGNEGLGNTTGLRYFLLRPEGLEIGTDSAEAIFCSSIRAPRGKFVINIHFVEPRPNPRGQESGRLCPPMGVISTTGPVVVSQRPVDMKRCARTSQSHVEDTSLFFETF